MDPDLPIQGAFVLGALSLIPATPLTVAIEIILFILLLFSSALFSGSEVALFSLDGAALHHLEKSEDRAGQRVVKLLSEPREVLVSILIMNTIVNVTAAILAAVMTGQLATALGWSHTAVVIVEIVALTFVLLVVSEITPKLVASNNPARFGRKVSWVILTFHRLLRPFSRLVARSTQIFSGVIKPVEKKLSGEDVKAMAEIGEQHGTFGEDERDFIHSIVEFGERAVREIMISRLDITAIPVTATLQEALDIIRDSGHSRLPLYVDHLDNILGIVHSKDLLPYLDHDNKDERLDWTTIARKSMFVPQGKKLDDLLNDFQSRKTHIAVVVDEYGGTAGIVTLENVLEEVIGEIQDEHDDTDETLFELVSSNTIQCDAKLDLDDLNEILGVTIPTTDLDFETVGGLVFHLSGTVPEQGDIFQYDALTITVDEVENRRIVQVTIRKEPTGAEANA